MNIMLTPQPPRRTPFAEAIEAIRSSGASVAPSDIPGLVWINGQELTMGQAIDFARQLRA